MRTQSICLIFAVVLLSHVSSAQWTHIGLAGRSVTDVAVGDNILFAITRDSGSVFYSTNEGASWSCIVPSTSLYHGNLPGVRGVAVAPSGVALVISSEDSLFRSSDNGHSWLQVAAPGPVSVTFCQGECFFLGYGMASARAFWTQFYRSTDAGLSWEPPSFSCGGVQFSFAGSEAITLGHDSMYSDFIQGSSDGGLTWQQLWSAQFLSIYAISLDPNGHILCGQLNGLYCTADQCTTWAKLSSIVAKEILSLPSGGVLVGTDTTGIFMFSANGDSLGTRNEGLTSLNVHRLVSDPLGHVYAGTDDGIWRRPISQIVSVKEAPMNVPDFYVLSQNYPNPFNPSTTIKYELPKSSQVTLSVFDMLGREVSVLVNERRDAGVLEVKFDGQGFSSGVYFYRLQAGDFTQTKRLLLLK